ncbi:MAG: hypothetical protein JSV79_11985 [Armatimonadota bacterium]|nr:MAG: hypothetical protein JSV79_11985 [Armatimonadota bacterium]
MSAPTDADQDPNVDPDEGLGEESLADRLGQSTEEEGESLAEGQDVAALRAQLEDLTGRLSHAERVMGEQGQELGFYRRRFGEGAPGGGTVPGGTEGYPSTGAPGAGSPGPGGAPAVDPLQALITDHLLTGDVSGFAQGLRAEVQREARSQIQGAVHAMRSAHTEQAAFLEDHPEVADGDGREFFEDAVARLSREMPGLPRSQIMEMAHRRVTERLGRMGVEYDREEQDAQDKARGMQTTPGSGARKAGAGRARPKSRDEIQADHNVQTTKMIRDHQRAASRSPG